jgi:hypothetical protein
MYKSIRCRFSYPFHITRMQGLCNFFPGQLMGSLLHTHSPEFESFMLKFNSVVFPITVFKKHSNPVTAPHMSTTNTPWSRGGGELSLFTPSLKIFPRQHRLLFLPEWKAEIVGNALLTRTEVLSLVGTHRLFIFPCGQPGDCIRTSMCLCGGVENAFITKESNAFSRSINRCICKCATRVPGM